MLVDRQRQTVESRKFSFGQTADLNQKLGIRCSDWESLSIETPNQKKKKKQTEGFD